MSKITKKQAIEFNEKFTSGILALGAKSITPHTDSFTSFEMETKVGRLTMNLCKEQTYCFTIFSRFEDVNRAKLRFGCNPYSGKYNFHGTTEPTDVESNIKIALFMFEQTLK